VRHGLARGHLLARRRDAWCWRRSAIR
jgi:hypothetical protein